MCDKKRVALIIPVDQLHGIMQIVQRRRDLTKVKLRLRLRKLHFLFQSMVQFASIGKFTDDCHARWCLKRQKTVRHCGWAIVQSVNRTSKPPKHSIKNGCFTVWRTLNSCWNFSSFWLSKMACLVMYLIATYFVVGLC